MFIMPCTSSILPFGALTTDQSSLTFPRIAVEALGKVQPPTLSGVLYTIVQGTRGELYKNEPGSKTVKSMEIRVAGQGSSTPRG